MLKNWTQLFSIRHKTRILYRRTLYGSSTPTPRIDYLHKTSCSTNTDILLETKRLGPSFKVRDESAINGKIFCDISKRNERTKAEKEEFSLKRSMFPTYLEALFRLIFYFLEELSIFIRYIFVIYTRYGHLSFNSFSLLCFIRTRTLSTNSSLYRAIKG